MEGQNYSVKERLEQLEALMGKYTAGGKDLCVAFSAGEPVLSVQKASVCKFKGNGKKPWCRDCYGWNQ